MVNALWDEWGFSHAFVHATTDTDLPTPLIAKILTINTCISPCSYSSIPQWAHKTAFSEILGQSLEPLNDDKIYYEFDKLAHHQQSLEDHLFRITYLDSLNSKNLYEPFRSCHYVTMKDRASQRKKSEPIELTEQQRHLLKELNLHVTMPQKVV